MSLTFHPYGGDYSPGHPWYYRLGGRILSPREIKANAYAGEPDPHFDEQFAKIDKMEEPRRSNAIAEERAKIEAQITERIARYREIAREIHHLRRFIGPAPYDWHRQNLNEPTMGASLLHNHQSYYFQNLRALERLTVQESLFDFM